MTWNNKPIRTLFYLTRTLYSSNPHFVLNQVVTNRLFYHWFAMQNRTGIGKTLHERHRIVKNKTEKCPKCFHEICITLDSWNFQCRHRYLYFYSRWAGSSIRLMSPTANYVSQTNPSNDWKLLLNIQQNKKIYRPPFWQMNSRSYLSWVANYHFLLHVETQTNLIYDGASMNNLSTNGAVRQQWMLNYPFYH